MLNAVQWEQAKSLFEQAIDWLPEDRAEHLAKATQDLAVRNEVASLLEAADKTGGRYDRAALIDRAEDIGVLAPGVRVGAWTVERLIGHGGVGSVYQVARAEGGFAQHAALKLIQHPADAYLARFADERQVIAGLDHPNIGRLYDGGVTPDGHPYMVMELITGTSITRYAQDRKLDLMARLDLFAQLCGAVGYAHRNLVLHLDIKPGNCLVTDDGLVKLIDFGASRALAADQHAAAAGAMYTDAYAAPEQRSNAPLTTAADVFALGRVLADLIAGARPGSPRGVVADIDAIVARATRPDPGERYVGVSALEADVIRVRHGEPVAVRRQEPGYLWRRNAWRFRWPIVGAGVVFGTLVAGIVGVSIEARQAILARNYYQAEVDRGNAVRDFVGSMMHDTASDPAAAQTGMLATLKQRAQGLDHAYPDHPERYAQVAEFLTSLFSDLTDEVESSAIAARFLGSKAVAADPTATARVRFNYAQSLMLQGHGDEAHRQIGLAQAFWATDPANHLAELARSRIAEAQIERLQGDSDAAVTALRRGLAEAEQATVKTDEDVPDLQNSLALSLLETGQLDEADGYFAKARTYWEGKGRTDDSLVTIIQNQGAVALIRGDFPKAEALLQQSITQRRADFGGSAALAAADVDLAKAQLLGGNYRGAQASAAEGEAMGRKYLSDGSILTISAKGAQAAASCMLDQPDAADRSAALLATLAQRGGPVAAMAWACRARLFKRQGRSDDAYRGRSSRYAVLCVQRAHHGGRPRRARLLP
jgi:non-specific serine/threonine protein kinase/serine/threonine-protein kinase